MEDYKYVYFIESHEKKKSIKLGFSKNYTEFKDLKVVYVHEQYDYYISIYQLKIYPKKIKAEYKIRIILKEEKNDFKKEESFKKSIKNYDLNKDNYLFDFKFKENGTLIRTLPPKSLKLTLQNQFNYYINYLNTNNLNKNDLIISIQKYLEQTKKYDIGIYLTIFIYCDTTDTIQRHLDLFKPEILINTEKNVSISISIKEYLDLLEKNPDQMIKKLSQEKEEENKIQLFSIIFYFNFIFNKKRTEEVINNEMINEYIFKGISKHNVLFKELKLTNQQIENYINYVKTYDELKNVFKYYNSNVLELLRIINNNITKIIELYRLALEHKKIKGKMKKLVILIFQN